MIYALMILNLLRHLRFGVEKKRLPCEIMRRQSVLSPIKAIPCDSIFKVSQFLLFTQFLIIGDEITAA